MEHHLSLDKTLLQPKFCKLWLSTVSRYIYKYNTTVQLYLQCVCVCVCVPPSCRLNSWVAPAWTDSKNNQKHIGWLVRRLGWWIKFTAIIPKKTQLRLHPKRPFHPTKCLQPSVAASVCRRALAHTHFNRSWPMAVSNGDPYA